METELEIAKLKEAILEIYESIRCFGFTPRFTEMVKDFRNEIEAYNDKSL